ncbi:MAG: hypothetical protein EOP84_12635 [Verrucomicrobiaceae bacterium]|nr:MAG: hypothetical protein EOP84_12635 [Verrucomicrobiaceae bacterium]
MAGSSELPCEHFPQRRRYDGVGNTTLKHQEGTSPMTMSYDAASRLVTMVQGSSLTTFGYDRNGNTVQEEKDGVVTSHTYDRENRLRTSTPPGMDVVFETNYYDGDGLRRANMNLEGTLTYIWDGTDYLGETERAI